MTHHAKTWATKQALRELDDLRSLTQRELQVAILTTAGYSTTDIADRLGLCPITIRNYMKSIYAKLPVDNRVHLALLMHRYGWGSIAVTLYERGFSRSLASDGPLVDTDVGNAARCAATIAQREATP